MPYTHVTLWGDNSLEETGSYVAPDFNPDAPFRTSLDWYRCRCGEIFNVDDAGLREEWSEGAPIAFNVCPSCRCDDLDHFTPCETCLAEHQDPPHEAARGADDCMACLIKFDPEVFVVVAYQDADQRDAWIMRRATIDRRFRLPAARVAMAEFGAEAHDWIVALELGTVPETMA